MDKGICLDTNICIGLLKGNESVKSSMSSHFSASVYISSVSVFELFLRKTKIKEIEDFIGGIGIMPFDEKTAKRAGELYKEMQASGRTVDFRDLFIAATCIINNLSLATFNKKHFQNIKELKLLEI